VAGEAVRRAGGLIHFRCAALLATVGWALLHSGTTAAETKAGDLPPPPGALERELSGGLPTAVEPRGGAWDDLVKPIEIPFVIEGGHLILEATIDGGPPRPFLFDTGAVNLITPDVARVPRTAETQTARVGGFGPKTPVAQKTKVGRIAIGALVLEQPNVLVVDLPNHLVDRGSKPRLAGLIGSELLTRYAVTIDFQKRTLTLRSSGRYRPSAATIALRLGFSVSSFGMSHPSISAQLDGVEGEFLIDTGSGGNVFVSEGFQRRHAPFSRYSKVARFLSPGGIGGRLNVQAGFGQTLRLGALSMAPPLVFGADATAAGRPAQVSMGSRTAGIIGNGILRHFIVTLDRHAQRAYFDPVGDQALPNALYATGMILDKPDREAFEVLDVLPGTAAARAGLKRGDRIVEFSGRPARDLGYRDISTFGRNSGPKVAIRTADQRRIELTFGKILP
jgi:PDZ domain/Aspartyl protease